MTINWDEAYASRAVRMGASEIRELLKVLEQPRRNFVCGRHTGSEFVPR